jgi:hypothetical protein
MRPAARQETRRLRRRLDGAVLCSGCAHILRRILAPIAADLAGLRDLALLLVGVASALRGYELAAQPLSLGKSPYHCPERCAVGHRHRFQYRKVVVAGR